MIYFKKFASCIPVKGYCKSTVYDLNRKNVWSIDNFTYEVLNKDIISEELLKTLPQEVQEDLFDKEIIFPCSLEEASMFPAINTKWISSLPIQSCIIDIEHSSNFDIHMLANQLSDLGCKALQIRFSSSANNRIVEEILSAFIGKNIRSIELVIPYGNIDYFKLTKEYKALTTVIVHSAHKIDLSKCNGTTIITTSERYNGLEQCGIVEPNYFVCNRDLFFESLNYNSCLNKKISINAQGEIKNCPSCAKSYGNISCTNLKQIIENPDFNNIWSITKDQIDVCKDCEFRYMCTDCRVFIKDPTNIHSQPAKCSYNPYIAKWVGEDGYISIEECSIFTKENEC